MHSEPAVQWRRGGDAGGGLFSTCHSTSGEGSHKGPSKLGDAVLVGLPVSEILNGTGGGWLVPLPLVD